MKKLVLNVGVVVLIVTFGWVAWASYCLAPAWRGGLARSAKWELFYVRMTQTGYYESSSTFVRSPELKMILANSSHLEIHKLRPTPNSLPVGSYLLHNNSFAGYAVQKTYDIKDPNQKKRILDVLYSGLSATTNGRYPLGFEPQYGISATSRGKSIKLVIDFKHLRVRVMKDYGPEGTPVYGFVETFIAHTFEDQFQSLLESK